MSKTVSLVMIVKNESKIIKRCLDSVKEYIDYWVICDTGSTDGTQELVRQYFEDLKIPGRLYEHKWVNFAFNRSLAVSLAQNKSDYSLLMDADFVLNVKNKNFKEKLTADAYYIKFDGCLDYSLFYLVKSSLNWKYHGVTHEYINCLDAKIYSNLDDFNIIHVGDGGSKSDKFERDIRLLKEGIIKEPNNERYLFYLAQSYKDIGDHDNAIKYYDLRIEKGGWSEEVYFAMYQKGRSKLIRGDSFEDFKDALLKAYEYRPCRLEALYDLIRYCRLNNKNEIGFEYGIKAVNNEYPKDVLFINKPVHDWMFLEEVALCAYNIKKANISITLYDRIFNKKILDDKELERLNKNYYFFKKQVEELKLNNIKDEKFLNKICTKHLNKVAIIILNYNLPEKTDLIIDNLKKTVKHPHDIIVVDNGSDVIQPSLNTTVNLKQNVEKTNGWLMGLHYADCLENINKEQYFAYCFVVSSIL